MNLKKVFIGVLSLNIFTLAMACPCAKATSRRAFLIGSGAVLTSLVVPTTPLHILADPLGGKGGAHIIIGGEDLTVSAEAYNAFMELQWARFRNSPEFFKVLEDMLLNNLGLGGYVKVDRNTVSGVISDSKPLVTPTRELISINQVTKNLSGWQSIGLVNSDGGMVKGLVRRLSTGHFDNFLNRINRGQILSERGALDIIDQIDGREGSVCGNLLGSDTKGHILLEDEESGPNS